MSKKPTVSSSVFIPLPERSGKSKNADAFFFCFGSDDPQQIQTYKTGTTDLP